MFYMGFLENYHHLEVLGLATFFAFFSGILIVGLFMLYEHYRYKKYGSPDGKVWVSDGEHSYHKNTWDVEETKFYESEILMSERERDFFDFMATKNNGRANIREVFQRINKGKQEHQRYSKGWIVKVLNKWEYNKDRSGPIMDIYGLYFILIKTPCRGGYTRRLAEVPKREVKDGQPIAVYNWTTWANMDHADKVGYHRSLRKVEYHNEGYDLDD